MILLFTAVLLAGGNEYGQCSEEPERKDDIGRPLRGDIVIPQHCEGFKTIKQCQDNGQISIFDGSVTGTNLELQNGSLIVQKWRFGSWPDGIDSTVRLILEEPKPGLTFFSLIDWEYIWECDWWRMHREDGGILFSRGYEQFLVLEFEILE
ncbi:unnamed protein product [Prunus armeniaca]|uniref:Uncharacterized protein n=1 Tax=Prunus armeniaca TaxID=36596 RepID=A0A6J5U6A8_PRUAR|nr:unnamed protein product [Prunus armeniaca]